MSQTSIFALPAPSEARIPGVEPLRAVVACDGGVTGHRGSHTGWARPGAPFSLSSAPGSDLPLTRESLRPLPSHVPAPGLNGNCCPRGTVVVAPGPSSSAEG